MTALIGEWVRLILIYLTLEGKITIPVDDRERRAAEAEYLYFMRGEKPPLCPVCDYDRVMWEVPRGWECVCGFVGMPKQDSPELNAWNTREWRNRENSNNRQGF